MTDVLEIAKQLASEAPVQEFDDEPAGWLAEIPKSHNVTVQTSALEIQEKFNEEGLKFKNMKATPTAFIHNLLYLNGEKFDFTGRDYLLPIYNSGYQRVMLKTARQVEKCVILLNNLVMGDGSTKLAKHVEVGDSLAALNMATQTTTSGKVTWKSEVYTKPCLRITTRQGHSIEVATTHPVRTWEAWTEAGELSVKDKIAVVRRMRSAFFDEIAMSDEWLEVAAFMIGDGYVHSDKRATFTQNVGDVLNRVTEILTKNLGEPILPKQYGGRAANVVTFSVRGTPLEPLGLHEKTSYTQVVPACIFRASKKQTALFLNRLWSCDGHVKRNTDTKYSIEYASMSKELVRGVQALLWKFGIPSHIRENLPSIYKKRGELDKVSYILRVETARGIHNFLTEVGALGKSEGIPLPDLSKCNNNRDTLPEGLNELISRIYATDGVTDKRGTGGRALLQYGLRKTPEYALTYDKAKKYLEFFRSGDFDQNLVNELEAHINSDIYWDTIESIEDIGEQECVDFEVADHHNFIVDGVITHNSTLLANSLVIESLIRPFFKCLYVSPSHTQTRQFSNEKLKPVIEQSPLVAKYMLNHNVSSQVFEKGFANGSMMFLRSAFLTADRARGISSDLCAIDELQDMLISNIPVILECLSHSKHKFQRFAGTPKTFENTIEQYWEKSSQGEWMVPCNCTGGDKGKFWNFLDEKSISKKKGVICKNCGRRLDVTTGRWAMANPGSSLMGFRIPQLMVPWIINTPRDWEVLVHKLETYPMAQFYNEVLGISYDHASKPITQAEIQACCSGGRMWSSPLSPEAANDAKKYLLFAGVDWGEGRDGAGTTPSGKLAVASYTVLTIAGYDGKKFRIFYVKKYTGKEIDPDFIVREINQFAQTINLRAVGVDYGHGWGVNNALIRMLGQKRVITFQHLDNLGVRRKWDERGMKFELNRNLLMSELFLLMKAQLVTFPSWEEYKPFAKDIMAIYAEYCEYARKIKFDHKPSEPDDAFHSLLYSWQAANIFLGRKD